MNDNDMIIDPDGPAPTLPVAGQTPGPAPSSAPEASPAVVAERRLRENDSLDLLDPFAGSSNPVGDFPGGLTMEPFSLTTIGWMKRAGSNMLGGKMPTADDLPGVLREISIYVLAHNSAIPPTMRSRIFRGVNGPGGESDLEDQLDLALKDVPMGAAKGLFAMVAKRIAEDMRQMPVPETPKKKGPTVPGVDDREPEPGNGLARPSST